MTKSTPLPSEQTWTAGMGNRLKGDLLRQLAAMKRNKSMQDVPASSEVRGGRTCTRGAPAGFPWTLAQQI